VRNDFQQRCSIVSNMTHFLKVVLLPIPGASIAVHSVSPLFSLIWIKVAVGLNLGGIDFLPKFYGISHATKLNIFVKHEQIYNNLIHIITENNKILSVDFSSNVYKDFRRRSCSLSHGIMLSRWSVEQTENICHIEKGLVLHIQFRVKWQADNSIWLQP
jgi:hypothetical protein